MRRVQEVAGRNERDKPVGSISLPADSGEVGLEPRKQEVGIRNRRQGKRRREEAVVALRLVYAAVLKFDRASRVTKQDRGDGDRKPHLSREAPLQEHDHRSIGGECKSGSGSTAAVIMQRASAEFLTKVFTRFGIKEEPRRPTFGAGQKPFEALRRPAVGAQQRPGQQGPT